MFVICFLFHLDSQKCAGKLSPIRICDDSPSIVCATANEVSNDVRNVRDHSLEERLASIWPRVERAGAGLAFRNKVRAEEIRKLWQKVVNIIFTKEENCYPPTLFKSLFYHEPRCIGPSAPSSSRHGMGKGISPSFLTSSLTFEPVEMVFGSFKVRMAETEILAPDSNWMG